MISVAIAFHYYHYQLARTAFDAGDYEATINHLKVAIRTNKNDDKKKYHRKLEMLMSDGTARLWHE